MIALLTACLFFEIVVYVLNIASAKARAKTVFSHLNHKKNLFRCVSLLLLLLSSQKKNLTRTINLFNLFDAASAHVF